MFALVSPQSKSKNPTITSAGGVLKTFFVSHASGGGLPRSGIVNLKSTGLPRLWQLRTFQWYARGIR